MPRWLRWKLEDRRLKRAVNAHLSRSRSWGSSLLTVVMSVLLFLVAAAVAMALSTPPETVNVGDTVLATSTTAALLPELPVSPEPEGQRVPAESSIESPEPPPSPQTSATAPLAAAPPATVPPVTAPPTTGPPRVEQPTNNGSGQGNGPPRNPGNGGDAGNGHGRG